MRKARTSFKRQTENDWSLYFALLLEYGDKNGSCDVPFDFVVDSEGKEVKLGEWLHVQRTMLASYYENDADRYNNITLLIESGMLSILTQFEDGKSDNSSDKPDPVIASNKQASQSNEHTSDVGRSVQFKSTPLDIERRKSIVSKSCRKTLKEYKPIRMTNSPNLHMLKAKMDSTRKFNLQRGPVDTKILHDIAKATTDCEQNIDPPPPKPNGTSTQSTLPQKHATENRASSTVNLSVVTEMKRQEGDMVFLHGLGSRRVAGNNIGTQEEVPVQMQASQSPSPSIDLYGCWLTSPPPPDPSFFDTLPPPSGNSTSPQSTMAALVPIASSEPTVTTTEDFNKEKIHDNKIITSASTGSTESSQENSPEVEATKLKNVPKNFKQYGGNTDLYPSTKTECVQGNVQHALQNGSEGEPQQPLPSATPMSEVVAFAYMKATKDGESPALGLGYVAIQNKGTVVMKLLERCRNRHTNRAGKFTSNFSITNNPVSSLAHDLLLRDLHFAPGATFFDESSQMRLQELLETYPNLVVD